jgi:hypothetical protein
MYYHNNNNNNNNNAVALIPRANYTDQATKFVGKVSANFYR